MKLQVAIDLLSTADALALLKKVANQVDVIELGTPLIKQEGLSVVTNVKAAYPDKLVFADMKTMDAGESEADLAFDAGGGHHDRVGHRRRQHHCGSRKVR